MLFYPLWERLMSWKGARPCLLLFRLSKEARLLLNLSGLFDLVPPSVTNRDLRLCILQRLVRSVYRHGVVLDNVKELSRYL
ncbi:hypothetical protein HAT2_00411 [Candidatus Similichlamydia laticola]|uniref:Uncharacterized protein n=1 Tax=Candidatus Similichlamydia laticola TaxID=2170265 RepID=A0A369KFL2_9BACT|nr:hypothetical protein HAT2_00411 [Candidatus Similichlamydia laticola]